MTIGFGENGTQKARDAHGGVSPWVSPGPSIAIPSHGNWELSIPQSLSAPLVSTQHSPPLTGCSCWGPFHSPSQDSASSNMVLPGRSPSPLLLVQTQISLLLPLSTPHRTTWNTKRTKTKGDRQHVFSGDPSGSQEEMPSNVLRSGEKDSMEWTCLLWSANNPPYVL